MAEQPKKKVVNVEAPSAKTTQNSAGGAGTASGAPTASKAPKRERVDPAWTPTPEAKAQAGKLRLISWILWALAIAGEAFAIFWVLKQITVNMWLLIGLIVVIGALALIAAQLWKKANRLDPASERDKVRFFVQNQLGAIMTIVAFLPLIILVFLNKNMDGKQKGIAGGIAIAVMIAVGLLAADYTPPSVEQYANEQATVVHLTGEDKVTWTKSGKVFHLCETAKAVNLESKDGQIFSGPVAAAHEAGKDRLTKQLKQEMEQCGFDLALLDTLPDEQAAAVDVTPEDQNTEDTPAEDEAPTETEAP